MSEPDRRAASPDAAFAVVTVTLLLFALVAASVQFGIVTGLDDALRFGLHRHACPPLTALLHAATHLGASSVWLPGTILAVVVLVRRGRLNAALLFAAAMAGSFPLQLALKALFHRVRPVPFFGIAAPSSYSFPSGHALDSVCFYGSLALILAPAAREPPAPDPHLGRMCVDRPGRRLFEDLPRRALPERRPGRLPCGPGLGRRDMRHHPSVQRASMTSSRRSTRMFRISSGIRNFSRFSGSQKMRPLHSPGRGRQRQSSESAGARLKAQVAVACFDTPLPTRARALSRGNRTRRRRAADPPAGCTRSPEVRRPVRDPARVLAARSLGLQGQVGNDPTV